MSSTIDNAECPDCGGEAMMEQDTNTCEVHVWCPGCGYDSDFEDDDDLGPEFEEIEDFEDYYEDEDEWD